MRPLIPAPWVTLIAVVLTFALVVNIFATGTFPDYDGTQGTYVLAGLVAGVLGLPFGVAMFRRGEDEVPPPPEAPPVTKKKKS